GLDEHAVRPQPPRHREAQLAAQETRLQRSKLEDAERVLLALRDGTVADVLTRVPLRRRPVDEVLERRYARRRSPDEPLHIRCRQLAEQTWRVGRPQLAQRHALAA